MKTFSIDVKIGFPKEEGEIFEQIGRAALGKKNFSLTAGVGFDPGPGNWFIKQIKNPKSKIGFLIKMFEFTHNTIRFEIPSKYVNKQAIVRVRGKDFLPFESIT